MPKTQGFLAAIFQDYRSRLMHYILRSVPDHHDATDLMQEVFERFLRTRQANPCPEMVRDPVKYLFGIAAHVVYDHLQRAGRQRRCLIVDSEVVDSLNEQLANACPDYLAEQLSAERSLERVLASLAPTHRLVVVLTLRDGLSHAEAARQLRLSANTVKKYFNEARAQLRTRWKRDDRR